jgi:1,4-dihydroxy-2-naphthoate octaprenyltransferase
MSSVQKQHAAQHRPVHNLVQTFSVWLKAVRIATLPIGLIPVFIASALAFAHDNFSHATAFIAGACAVLMQITSNLVNDVYDFRRGADAPNRLGPARAVASGLLSERSVRRAAWTTGVVAFLLGQYLVWLGGWQILAIGVLALVVAWAYTGGPFPLAYKGLGEVTAFVFFGVVPVCGTYFVLTRQWSAQALLVSLVPGLFAAAILMINNIRDIPTDIHAHKRTLPVRLGDALSRRLVRGILYGAVLLPVLFWVSGWSAWILLELICIPLVVRLGHAVSTADGAAFNAVLLGVIRMYSVSTVLLIGGILLWYYTR